MLSVGVGSQGRTECDGAGRPAIPTHWSTGDPSRPRHRQAAAVGGGRAQTVEETLQEAAALRLTMSG